MANTTIKLTKNQGIKIRKMVSFNKPVTVALGWKTNRYTGGEEFDLDLSLAICDEDDKCIDMKHLVWFNNTKAPRKCVCHSGDNLTGDDDGGDAETAKIIFNKVPATAKYIHCFVTIFEAEKRDQNFGLVDDAYIRLLDENGEEKARFDLSEDEETSDKTSMEFARFIRTESDDDWEFKIIGEGKYWEIEEWIVNYGLDLTKIAQRYCPDALK